MIDIKNIAKLARIEISKKEQEKLSKEIVLILDYFKKLKQVDISGTNSFIHPCLSENVMREDKVEKQSMEKNNKLVEAMPETKNRYTKVKNIL